MREGRGAVGPENADAVAEPTAHEQSSGAQNVDPVTLAGFGFEWARFTQEELTSAEDIRVELTGGVYRSSSHDLIGHAVAKSLTSIYADSVIFGAAAISFTRGIMVHDPDAQHELLQAGKRRILVVDSSKIGTEATYRLCGIEDCDLILTDKGISSEDLERLRRTTEVRVAE